ncbi:MAG: type VI secretion system tip protein TssI/VgrG [Rhodospirillales bacterium]|nr:type VI secretion system tip protein TssI/VgrG [Rhodospirillales bacterium]
MSGSAGGGSGGRALTISVSGQATDFIPVGFHAEEAISSPFLLAIDFYAPGAPLSADDYLFKPVSLKAARPGGPVRHFNGMISRMVSHGTARRGHLLYSFDVVPKLWFLTQTIDCRIFPDASATDIFAKIFQELNIDYDCRLQAQPSTRKYTTQFNETDLAFVTRLMEEEGLYYYFEHSESAHKLVILNYNGAFKTIEKDGLNFAQAGENFDVVSSFRRRDATAYGAVTLADYDPVTVNNPSNTSATLLKASGTSGREVYLWPAHTDQSSLLAERAKFRSEAADAAAALYEGEGRHEGFFAGGKFTLAGDPVGAADRGTFVIRGVTHDFSDPTWVSGGGEISYANRFSAFPQATTWRQPFATPRPHLGGVHSAVVITESGEIDSEAIGRIKVSFFWDHRQDETGNNAIWVRVIQPWSGSGWGWQHIPRKGTEVAVAFMHGDPDQPVVIGCFYNGSQKPPFALPDEQTKSGIRSRSSANGSTSTYSEFSIDDTKGKELVLLHAEKDLSTEVEHDQTLKVGNCRTVTVKKDETITIDGDQSLSVKGKVGHTSEKDYAVTSSSGNVVVKANAGSVKVSGAQAIELVVGEASTIKMDPSSITLTVGGNSVKIDPSGVAINGTMIKAAAQALLDLKGPMAQVSGDGMLTLKGGLVQVN